MAPARDAIGSRFHYSAFVLLLLEHVPGEEVDETYRIRVRPPPKPKEGWRMRTGLREF